MRFVFVDGSEVFPGRGGGSRSEDASDSGHGGEDIMKIGCLDKWILFIKVWCGELFIETRDFDLVKF